MGNCTCGGKDSSHAKGLKPEHEPILSTPSEIGTRRTEVFNMKNFKNLRKVQDIKDIYTFGRELGKGSFGAVLKAKRKMNN